MGITVWSTVLSRGFLVEEPTALVGGCVRQPEIALEFEKRGIVIPRFVIRSVEVHRWKHVLTQRLCDLLRLAVDVALFGSTGNVALVLGFEST